jgi:hypothetical protein
VPLTTLTAPFDFAIVVSFLWVLPFELSDIPCYAFCGQQLRRFVLFL